jgi:ABC-type dipeptide/oligopeptide/nickel transport system ATPase component
VIRSICDRVVVMQSGTIVEQGPCEQVFAAPRADYTRMLLDAIPLPILDPDWLSRGPKAENVGMN